MLAVLIALVQRHSRHFRFEGPLKLRVTRSLPKSEQRFEYAQQLITELGGEVV